MEALGNQPAKSGGQTAVLTRAVSPFGGASSNAMPDAGTRVSPLDADAGLAAAIALTLAAASSAPATLAKAGYVEASEFAGHVEELSRTVEYLQILAAGAVDRSRAHAIIAAATKQSTRSWTTGWDNGTETLNETDAARPASGTTAADRRRQSAPASSSAPGPSVQSIRASSVGSPADDGCKNTAEFLRLRLRIGISEARRRVHLAQDTLPATTLTGAQTIPLREHLSEGLTPTAKTAADTTADTPDSRDTEMDTSELARPVAGPAVSSHAGTIISLTLDRLQHQTTPEMLARIERDLTRTAATSDPDFLGRVAHRWAETINADGTEPTEETLRHTQGAFIRKPRHGLHHLEIFATTDQYEHLLTVMNTATNPRATTPTTDSNGWQDTGPDVDWRTRSQKQLDGIIGAVKAALTTNTLPATGGNRPQIIATINYRDLFPRPCTEPGSEKSGTGTGNFVFTGPVAAAALRKLACDADIIPALLGTSGQILDLGRKTRLFTPAQRLALTARDQGCTFPNCTIPAPWCEAHHITYWSHHGPTNVSNGTLLCSHHHNLIHKERWTIHTIHGIPWFTPPRHIDPTQKPQQNHYFKPPPPPPRE